MAHQPQPTRMGPNPPGRCFRCNQTGHWAKSCPNPQPPTKPCPTRKQWLLENELSSGTTYQISGSISGPTTMGREPDPGGPGTPDHGSLDEVRDDPIVPELFQWRSPSSRPHVHPIWTDSELRVIGTVAGHEDPFIIDTGVAFSLLTSFQALSNLQKGPSKGSHEKIPFHPQITPHSPLFFWKNNTLFYSSSSMPTGINGMWSSR